MNEERLYINGHQVNLPIGQPIAKTYQINDIGSLADRQSNFTRTINLPKDPTNIKALDFLGVVGNNSNVPYQRNIANYFVGNECLIYNGWANIKDSDSDSYQVTILDGIIDFQKAIENDYITTVGVTDLNHTKTIENIIGSWSGGTEYRYMIADYNGKKTYTPTGTTDTIINTDYLIPSARVKYIWDRIFDYYGFTYSGSTFNTENFTNLWISYPKPTPTLIPNKILINTQECYPIGYEVHYFQDTAYFVRTDYVVSILRENFTSIYASVSGCGTTTTTSFGDEIPNGTWYEILLNGTYAIDCETNNQDMSYYIKDASNSIIETGVLELDSTGTKVGKLFNCLTGYKVFVNNSPSSNYQASFEFTFSKVDGFAVDFDQVFLDFKVKDFIVEILQRFSLTMFPDKYTNNITFLTTEEWLESTDIIDWSYKNPKPINTTYALNNYCQNNRFKYKYNDDNANYNDGLITIDNVNLPDERTVIQSRIYTPEKLTEPMVNFDSNVYKFWNKEVKDNGTVNYKPLDNRFYFLRSLEHSFGEPTMIGSEYLNTTGITTSCQIESYSRLRFQDIINDYYQPISSILNSSKIQTVEIYLTPQDVNEFDFRKMIYLEQFGSYFLVNKINNFVPFKNTKVELIEVDYVPNYDSDLTPIEDNTATFITIDSISVDGCEVTLTYSTDATIGTDITVIGQPNTFGLPVLEPIDPMYYYYSIVNNSGSTGNTISLTLEAGTFYQFQLSIIGGVGIPDLYSNIEYFENVASCTYTSPSGITITNVTFLADEFLSKRYSIDFTTDATLPRTVYYADYKPPVGFFGGWSPYTGVDATTGTVEVVASIVFGEPEKFRLKIGDTISNEFTI